MFVACDAEDYVHLAGSLEGGDAEGGNVLGAPTHEYPQFGGRRPGGWGTAYTLQPGTRPPKSFGLLWRSASPSAAAGCPFEALRPL